MYLLNQLKEETDLKQTSSLNSKEKYLGYMLYNVKIKYWNAQIMFIR